MNYWLDPIGELPKVSAADLGWESVVFVGIQGPILATGASEVSTDRANVREIFRLGKCYPCGDLLTAPHLFVLYLYYPTTAPVNFCSPAGTAMAPRYSNRILCEQARQTRQKSMKIPAKAPAERKQTFGAGGQEFFYAGPRCLPVGLS